MSVMTFAEAWDAFTVGDQIRVMDGLGAGGTSSPEPKPGGHPWRAWRSHNFTGELREKIEEPGRAFAIAMRCALTAPNARDNEVIYTVVEDVPHGFAAGGGEGG